MKMLLHKSLIEELINNFRSYLQTAGHTEKTIRSYCRVVQIYLTWLDKNKLPYIGISYQQLLGYIKYRRDKGHKVKTINQNILVLRKFYGTLLKEDPNDEIILATIQSLGDLKQRGGTTILHDLLSKEQLQSIYQICPTNNMIQKRNKCILGMMIYQGLRAGDICRIKLMDVDLVKAKVYIASTSRSNERTLALHASQINQLQKYILGVRPGLLNYSKNGSSEYLFISFNATNGVPNLRASLTGLYQKLVKEHPELKHMNQIRSSVIRHWLKQENIRVVQYKLGHRYLSSTQAYLEGDIESLQQQINRLHPLKED